MYVPTLDVILSELKLSHAQISTDPPVIISGNLFRFLLQVALLDSEFNEDGYLEANPDIRNAVEIGDIADPRLHYIWTGYFEGRIGATPAVDEGWYLTAYPDVAAAVEAGTVASAADHFAMVGAKELRAPGPEFQGDVVHWGKLLRGEESAANPDQTDEDDAGPLNVWPPESQGS